MKATFRMLSTLIILSLAGCSHAVFTSSSIGQQEPFSRYLNRPLALAVPVAVCYAEQSPIDNFWYRGTYKKGDMYYLSTDGREEQKAFDAPAGTPLEINKVLYHTNISGSYMVAFGKIYIKELGKAVPFHYYWSLYSDADRTQVLRRAPWEPLDVPEQRKLRTGPLANQYRGLE